MDPLSVVSIGIGALNLGMKIFNFTQSAGTSADIARMISLQEEYTRNQIDDIERKGNVQLSQFRVNALRQLGELETRAANSGVTMAGTAGDIYRKSEENIAVDEGVIKDEIASAIENAKLQGELDAYRLQMELMNSETESTNALLDIAGSALNFGADLASADIDLSNLFSSGSSSSTSTGYSGTGNTNPYASYQSEESFLDWLMG